MQVKLRTPDEVQGWENIAWDIRTLTCTSAIRGVEALYAGDKAFREALQEAAKRRGVDKDGRLTK